MTDNLHLIKSQGARIIVPINEVKNISAGPVLNEINPNILSQLRKSFH